MVTLPTAAGLCQVRHGRNALQSKLSHLLQARKQRKKEEAEGKYFFQGRAQWSASSLSGSPPFNHALPITDTSTNESLYELNSIS